MGKEVSQSWDSRVQFHTTEFVAHARKRIEIGKLLLTLFGRRSSVAKTPRWVGTETHNRVNKTSFLSEQCTKPDEYVVMLLWTTM